MKKKVKLATKPKTMTSDDHRKKADKHRAMSQLHEAKATMLDVDAPPAPKGKGKITVRPY